MKKNDTLNVTIKIRFLLGYHLRNGIQNPKDQILNLCVNKSCQKYCLFSSYLDEKARKYLKVLSILNFLNNNIWEKFVYIQNKTYAVI